MGGIVVKTATALIALGAPSRTLGAKHDRAIGLRQNMGDVTQRAAVDDALHFLEGGHIAVVIADLIHESPVLRQGGERLGILPIQAERLFAENM